MVKIIGNTIDGNYKYIAIAEDGLVYTPGWDYNIVRAMKLFDLQSASPFCPLHHGPLSPLDVNKYDPLFLSNIMLPGKTIGRHIAPWCIVIKCERDIKHPESVEELASMIALGDFKHGLVLNSIVHRHAK